MNKIKPRQCRTVIHYFDFFFLLVFFPGVTCKMFLELFLHGMNK